MNWYFMGRSYYLLFAGIFFNVTIATSQKKEWPLQVRFVMSAILIQGDTSAYLTKTDINGEKVPLYNFNFDSYRKTGANRVDTAGKSTVSFLNSFLFPENKRYSTNKFALSLDSFNRRTKPYSVFNRNPALLRSTATRKDRLKLLLTNAFYDISGKPFGEDSISLRINMNSASSLGISGSYFTALIFSIYSYVAHDQLKSFVITYIQNGKSSRQVMVVDEKFQRDYSQYIDKWTENLAKVSQNL